MIAAVADTHALLWYLYNDSRLSLRAQTFIETTLQQGNQLALPSITFVEMVYLIEKGRIASESLTIVGAELSHTDSAFIEIPVDLKIARAMARVDAVQIADMPDRIIAATALHLGLPVISRDGKIRLSSMATIW
jgi:PIN domain nuclease of toxin-antitoxin system